MNSLYWCENGEKVPKSAHPWACTRNAFFPTLKKIHNLPKITLIRELFEKFAQSQKMTIIRHPNASKFPNREFEKVCFLNFKTTIVTTNEARRGGGPGGWGERQADVVQALCPEWSPCFISRCSSPDQH